MIFLTITLYILIGMLAVAVSIMLTCIIYILIDDVMEIIQKWKK